jgi:hypothetical protein
MKELGLSRDELEEVTRACASIRLGYSTPSYFQDFLALRVGNHRPDVSSRIRDLNAQQVDELRRYLCERQAWLQG